MLATTALPTSVTVTYLTVVIVQARLKLPDRRRAALLDASTDDVLLTLLMSDRNP